MGVTSDFKLDFERSEAGTLTDRHGDGPAARPVALAAGRRAGAPRPSLLDLTVDHDSARALLVVPVNVVRRPATKVGAACAAVYVRAIGMDVYLRVRPCERGKEQRPQSRLRLHPASAAGSSHSRVGS
jgi:hypothetical protein